MKCVENGCDAEIVSSLPGEFMTLVGYWSPPGHNHDDNCLKRGYVCASGHSFELAIRRRCAAPGCGWVGRDSCGCHRGPEFVMVDHGPTSHPRVGYAWKKLDAWPELPEGRS